MKEITIEPVKIVNIKDNVLYYLRVTVGKTKVTIKTDKKTFADVEAALKKEVKAA